MTVATSKWGPVTDEEVTFIAEKLQNMYSGAREYRTSYGLRNEYGEGLDGRVDFSAGGYDITLDEEVDSDPQKRVQTYVHELIHGMRGIRDDDLAEDFVQDLTAQVLLRLYRHADRNVREMAYEGYQAHVTRTAYFTRNDSGITDDEFEEQFGEYFYGAAGQPSDDQERQTMNYYRNLFARDPHFRKFVQMAASDERKRKQKIDEEVRNFVQDRELPARHRELKGELEGLRKKRKGAEDKYKSQIDKLKSETDSGADVKGAARGAVKSVAGAVEGLGRRVAKTPLNIVDMFLDNYSGGIINPKTSSMISGEPNITNTIDGLVASRMKSSFEKGKSARVASVEAEQKKELDAIDAEIKAKIGEYGEYLYNRQLREQRERRNAEEQARQAREREEFLRHADAHEDDDTNYEGIFVNGEPLSEYLQRTEGSGQGSNRRRRR